jgi:hypothetical protein
MLRRVARALRLFLVVCGLGLLAWIPVSLAYRVEVVSGRPHGLWIFQVGHGGVTMRHLHSDHLFQEIGPYSEIVNVGTLPWQLSLMPYKSSTRVSTRVELPLWLLAAVCLAWPVTSLLVRRRRRGRGFEVEAKAAGDSAAAT